MSRQCDLICDSTEDVRAVRDPEGELLDMCAEHRSQFPVEVVAGGGQ